MNPSQFKEFLSALSPEFIPIIDSSYTKEDYIHIDLSVTNNALNHIDVSSSKAFGHYIDSYLKHHQKKIAYGGYIETRGIYNRSDHFNQNDPETERNIHLGLDVWVKDGTSVLAPIEGKVHSFQDNTNFGDYGPTIILEHTLNKVTFYTLYGHLSTSSLTHLRVGIPFKKGDVIATLGSSDVNGDYAPHLHFQIIKHISNYKGDYPGVASKITLEALKANGEDPNILLKIS